MTSGLPARYSDRVPPDMPVGGLGALTDISSPIFGIVSTAATAGITLIEHRNLSVVGRAGYRLAMAALAGLYGVAATRQESDQLLAEAALAEEPSPEFITGVETPAPAVVGVLAAGATLGLAELNEAIDGRVVDWIRDRGVSHPRALLAAAGAGLMGAMWWSDRRRADQLAASMAEAEEVEPVPAQPLDERVLAILDGMIRPELPGGQALREQLGSVQHANAWPEFMTDLELEVDEDAPRAIPFTQVWPVQGRFVRDGVELAIELQIHQGRLEMISLMAYDPDEDGDVDFDDEVETDYERSMAALDEMTEWPEVTEVRFVLDGEDSSAR